MTQPAGQTPRLVSCYFGDDPNGHWSRMASVLSYTAAKHCAGWERTILHLPPFPEDRFKKQSHVANTNKMGWWRDRVHEAPDGTCMLLIDVDTAILRPIDDIWYQSFDFAYCIRTGHGHPGPLNGGVVFLRVSDRTRAFMTLWADGTKAMLNAAGRPDLHRWLRTHKGCAQAALGRLLHSAHGLHIRTLGCIEWNCEDSAWERFNQDFTRILHVKSALRDVVFPRPLGGKVRRSLAQDPQNPKLLTLKKLWLTLEHEASGREAVTA